MPLSSAAFLDIVLSRPPTTAEIDELLGNHVDEDLHLDYKRGRWLMAKDAARQLRRYVAGFANADSGAVVIGLAGGEKPQQPGDKQWAVDGCPTGRAQPWYEWASNSLSPISGYLSRQPRIHSVGHAEGEVLVVSVQRSSGLVPCVEDGRPVQYVRVGHQTLRIDPYLYADLLLGRRQSPHFEVELSEPTIEPGQPAPGFGVRINFTVRNESLVWVPDLQIGIIGIGTPGNPPTMRCTDGGGGGDRTQGERTISRALGGYVDVLPSRHAFDPEPYVVRSRPRPALNTAPFASIACDALFTLPIVDRAQRWWGAIYVAPTSGLPQWFAVRLEYQSLPMPHLVNVTKTETSRVEDQRIPIDWGNLNLP